MINWLDRIDRMLKIFPHRHGAAPAAFKFLRDHFDKPFGFRAGDKNFLGIVFSDETKLTNRLKISHRCRDNQVGEQSWWINGLFIGLFRIKSRKLGYGDIKPSVYEAS